MKKMNKKAGLWLFGVSCLALQLLAYGAVSLSLADGILLGAGQAAVLLAGAVYLLIDRRARTDTQEDRRGGTSRTDGKKRETAKRGTLGATLSVSLGTAGYAVSFVCFAFLLTLPLQKGLSLLGVASLNETGVFTSLWERLLYCWLLPAVTATFLLCLAVIPRLERTINKQWQTALLAGVFCVFFLPQLGSVLAHWLMGVLLCLLYVRTRSLLTTFSVSLVMNGFLFLQSYLQTLGVSGAEAYTMAQCVGIGLTFSSLGAVVFYLNEKKESKKKVKALELLCLLVVACFLFVLGMALWLG